MNLTGCFAGGDPYVIAECEGEKSHTPVKKDTLDPTFNSHMMFYAKHPQTTEVHFEVCGLHHHVLIKMCPCCFVSSRCGIGILLLTRSWARPQWLLR